MSDHGWDSGERQVEEEEISGESRRQGKQEGEEVAISTHLLEGKHQVKLWRNRDEKQAPPNTPTLPPTLRCYQRGCLFLSASQGKEEKS